MTTKYDYSATAASNATVGSINWAEGQAPSTVNNSARELMAVERAHLTDQSALTTGGTSTAYTVTTTSVFAALTDGMTLALRMHTASGAAPTLSPDGLTARTMLRQDGSAIVAGDLKQNSTYIVRYRTSNTSWYVEGADNISSFGRTLIDDVDVAAARTTLGISTYGATLIDDADAAAALTTLGVSSFVQTILNDADAAAVRSTIGAGTGNGNGTVTSVAGSAGLTGTVTSSGNISIDTNNTMGVGCIALLQNISGSPIGSAGTAVNTNLNMVDISTTGFTPTVSPSAGTWRNISGQSVNNNNIGLFIRTV